MKFRLIKSQMHREIYYLIPIDKEAVIFACDNSWDCHTDKIVIDSEKGKVITKLNYEIHRTRAS
jgi:hypothetical protein